MFWKGVFFFMKTTLSKYLAALFILLSLMWITGEILLLSDEKKIEIKTAEEMMASSSPVEVVTIPSQAHKESLSLPKVIAPSAPVSPLSITTASTTTKEDSRSMGVTLVIDGHKSIYALPEHSTAFALMDAATREGDLRFTFKEYSGLGALILSINGKKSNQAGNDMYWIYSVNGKKATVGVSQYVLHDGDQVSWSYEPSTL